MAMAATTSRDLNANRAQVEQSIEDALGQPLAVLLKQVGFGNEAAGTFAEVLAESLAGNAVQIMFDLLQSDADLRAATAA